MAGLDVLLEAAVEEEAVEAEVEGVGEVVEGEARGDGGAETEVKLFTTSAGDSTAGAAVVGSRAVLMDSDLGESALDALAVGRRELEESVFILHKRQRMKKPKRPLTFAVPQD